MDLIESFYARIMIAAIVILIVGVSVLVYFLFLVHDKTSFSNGVLLVLLMQTIGFGCLTIKFCLENSHWELNGINYPTAYDMEIHKCLHFLSQIKIRIQLEICTVVAALLFFLKSGSGTKIQGAAYALLISSSFMFFIDMYLHTALSDFVADLKILSHNSSAAAR